MAHHPHGERAPARAAFPTSQHLFQPTSSRQINPSPGEGLDPTGGRTISHSRGPSLAISLPRTPSDVSASSEPASASDSSNSGRTVLPRSFEEAPVEHIVVLVADMLQRLTDINDQIEVQQPNLTRFHSRTPPAISIRDYLARIVQYTKPERSCLLLTLHYVDLLCARNPAFALSSLTVHRFLIASITCSSKALCDVFCKNTHYARVGGLGLGELNLLEREFLEAIDWRLATTRELIQSYYESLVSAHPAYRLAPPPPTSAPASAHNSESSMSSSSSDAGEMGDELGAGAGAGAGAEGNAMGSGDGSASDHSMRSVENEPPAHQQQQFEHKHQHQRQGAPQEQPAGAGQQPHPVHPGQQRETWQQDSTTCSSRNIITITTNIVSRSSTVFLENNSSNHLIPRITTDNNDTVYKNCTGLRTDTSKVNMIRSTSLGSVHAGAMSSNGVQVTSGSVHKHQKSLGQATIIKHAKDSK
ncbi:cyclin-domain-containing protein [Dacryopinax primogenitus]|uniref:Cyclin-domain-containing protein n=1 Tax=Dacryopinax primogenitus (strain DJM 731) TaxID=1858805 RepID=M5FVP1_DACPD|nr:cyclin-domain-containing protein [Dacryopinax primogenitus]EJT97421.1 cyclin-domain-containing protein [Dacryopinax primogenitus]